jgi:hypothetical protein
LLCLFDIGGTRDVQHEEDTMTLNALSTTAHSSRAGDEMQSAIEFDWDWEPDSHWDCVPRD